MVLRLVEIITVIGFEVTGKFNRTILSNGLCTDSKTGTNHEKLFLKYVIDKVI